jgi:hypothetical protein
LLANLKQAWQFPLLEVTIYLKPYIAVVATSAPAKLQGSANALCADPSAAFFALVTALPPAMQAAEGPRPGQPGYNPMRAAMAAGPPGAAEAMQQGDDGPDAQALLLAGHHGVHMFCA